MDLFSPDLMSHIHQVEIKNYHTLRLHVDGSNWYQGMLRNFTSIRQQLRARHAWIKELEISLTKENG